jgi:hypothetical protein
MRKEKLKKIIDRQLIYADKAQQHGIKKPYIRGRP